MRPRAVEKKAAGEVTTNERFTVGSRRMLMGASKAGEGLRGVESSTDGVGDDVVKKTREKNLALPRFRIESGESRE